ncbi:MAG: hypothetical protein V4628_02105 [Pseudomonadota bacterium]
MLLLRIHKFALRLKPLRFWCLLLVVAGVVLIGYALLIAENASSSLLRMAIVMTLWSLLLFAFIQLFQNIPAPVLPKDRFIDRVRSHIKLGLYQLLAVGVALVGVVLLSMSLKLLLL